MYELIKTVILNHSYKDSNALIAKIQRMFIESEITEEQYNELREMVYSYDPSKAYNVEAELDRIWVAIREIEAKIADMPDPEPKPEPEDIPEWVQPTGAHDAYQTGDKVRYKGHVYVSLIDGNVWSPEAYPQGWQELLEGQV